MGYVKPASLAQKPCIGLMSGTSLDGVDGVLAQLAEPGQLRCLASTHAPIPPSLRQELMALNEGGPDELRRSALAANQLARLYAGVVTDLLSAARAGPEEVAAIGCHGQTVRHQPADGYTLQIVNAPLLTELTGITVVSDFRSRDVAAGGHGAPLVPAFHAAAFGVPEETRVIVNLGGFANLTVLTPGAAPRGYDCGPGNVLMDGWIGRHCGKTFDRDGGWAATGSLLPGLLRAFLAHPFFRLPPPRSTGREDFHLDWVLSHREVRAAAAEDVQRTLLELSAVAVADSVRAEIAGPARVFLCGGGAYNPLLAGRIAALLAPLGVAGTASLGMPEDQVEAFAFAWLAQRCLLCLPGNVPEVTGARGPRVLGAIHPA